MATRRHSTMTGTDHHSPGYIAASDPGAVGAGILWVDTSTTPHSLKKRNSGDTGWDQVGLVIGGSGTDAAAGNHPHVESDTVGLVSDLAGKAAATHTHAESDVTSLTSDLSGKAATSHTHASGDVTDWTEAVEDVVAALLQAGANVTVTYDDTANTLTIASSGGGGGGGTDPDVFVTAEMVDTGGLSKGQPVRAATGTPADSAAIPVYHQTSAVTDPTLGLAAAAIAHGATGLVQTQGTLSGIDTSAWTVGTVLYVNGSGDLIDAGSWNWPAEVGHRIGFVVVQDATAGSVRLTLVEDAAYTHSHQDTGDGGALGPWLVYESIPSGNPPAGSQFLYISTSDHKLYRKDSGGSSTLIG